MSVEYDSLTLERLGHASVRIVDGESTLYVDPWGEVIDGDPNDADVVFVTHDDFDHYDPDGIAAVAGSEVTVAAFDAIDTGDLDRDVVTLPHEGETTVAGIDVRSVPAFNDPDGEHVDDDGNPFHAEGEVIGLLFEIGGASVFYPSDTDFLDHHESLEADVDVFLPPIGGHYTMDRHEAADFARHLDPELVLPIHYDTFEAIETDAEAFAHELEDDGIRVELF